MIMTRDPIDLLLGQFGANFFQQFPGGEDPLRLTNLASFVLDAHVPVIAVVQHDLHHLAVIGVDLVARLVEVMGLGTDRLGERHEFRDTPIPVVLLAIAKVEIAEVWQGSTPLVVDLLDDRGQPLAVRAEPTVILWGAANSVRARRPSAARWTWSSYEPAEAALTRIE
jgi:hypothetical protein